MIPEINFINILSKLLNYKTKIYFNGECRMIPFATIKDDFKNISFNSEGLYDISYKILVSDDFGVSQKTRIFYWH